MIRSRTAAILTLASLLTGCQVVVPGPDSVPPRQGRPGVDRPERPRPIRGRGRREPGPESNGAGPRLNQRAVQYRGFLARRIGKYPYARQFAIYGVRRSTGQRVLLRKIGLPGWARTMQVAATPGQRALKLRAIYHASVQFNARGGVRFITKDRQQFKRTIPIR